MTKKRYDNPNETLTDQLTHSDTPANATVDELAAGLYSRVGERFKVDWAPWARGEPIVHLNTLPDGVNETDVETALNDMKADGLF